MTAAAFLPAAPWVLSQRGKQVGEWGGSRERKEPAGHLQSTVGTWGTRGCFLSHGPEHPAHASPRGETPTRPDGPAGQRVWCLLDLKPSSLAVYPSQPRAALGKAKPDDGPQPCSARGTEQDSSVRLPSSTLAGFSTQLCHTLPKSLSLLDGSQRVFQLPLASVCLSLGSGPRL